MMREVIKSKIHRLTVTRTDLNYKDSITIDEELMEKSDIMEGDKVSVININNDNRFEEIVIKGIRKTGIIGIKRDLVNYAKIDDILVILSYCYIPEEKIENHKTKIVFVNIHNMAID